MAHYIIPLTTELAFWKFYKESELPQTIQSTRTATASPQLTIRWSQGQGTLHCNLATQVQCFNARVTSSRVTYEIINKQCLNEVKQLEPCFKCLQPFLKNNSSSNN